MLSADLHRSKSALEVHIGLMSVIFASVLLKSISFNPSHGLHSGVILVGSSFTLGSGSITKSRNAWGKALSKAGSVNDGSPLELTLQRDINTK